MSTPTPFKPAPTRPVDSVLQLARSVTATDADLIRIASDKNSSPEAQATASMRLSARLTEMSARPRKVKRN